ncbi:hypothetical protein CPC16_003071 [Podila verticillata]|uniref:Uncharacterized protein n=1 Tax=Podila verticillata NRRL 6337 TaxID=1069443 RepID=A0A086TJH1_9FUNG|nr:hypothetical protein BGZ52_012073 [Haplosporangium bisporale]KAF9212204.1 hypothetical protein BGZ59_007086 [Podila verticillata]KAF9371430.1 hypothetical protein CPC16_003071 [Podila verticillata]KFH62098.1 hypothetical protein MVEG_11737 [Podila verticillata NRRL 6337]
MAVMAQSAADADAVVSAAAFVGEDTTDFDAQPVNIFKEEKNHATVASSVLVFSATGANFQPSLQPTKNLASAYVEFLKKATSFPGFGEPAALVLPLPFNNSVFQFETNIRNVIKNDPDRFLIARGLRDLLPGYIPDSLLKTWLLSFILIGKPEGTDDVYIKFARVVLTLKTDKEHTTIIPEQDAKFEISQVKVNSLWVAQHADALASKIQPIVSVRESIDFFASSKVIPSKRLDEASCGRSSSRLRIQGALNDW